MPISHVRVARSSGEDVDVVLSGTINVEEDAITQVLFDPEGLECKTARVMAATFSFETGLIGLLYWERESEHDLLLPLEGRGTLDFRSYSGLMNPFHDGATGRIVLRVTALQPYLGKTPRHFALALDLSKQRSI